jgi:hypothetical protein
LQEGLDGLVLLVELGKVGNEILDDVGVREGVDAGLGLGVGGNAAYWMLVGETLRTRERGQGTYTSRQEC